MTDVLPFLRGCDDPMMRAAADEIERLRAENERLALDGPANDYRTRAIAQINNGASVENTELDRELLHSRPRATENSSDN